MCWFYGEEGYFWPKACRLRGVTKSSYAKKGPKDFRGCFMELNQPGYFMNCCRETTKMGVPPGNRRVLVPRHT
jgi:hypothetical protein